MTLDGTCVPRFAPGHRLREDKVRGRWVILAPERLFEPDDIAIEVLRLVDGARTLDVIVDMLAVKFDAPREAIASSLTEMFSPTIISERVSGMLRNYDFVTEETLAYFKPRLTQARLEIGQRILGDPIVILQHAADAFGNDAGGKQLGQ